MAMKSRYLRSLYVKRTELENKLELHEARYCFGEGEIEDGTEAELIDRINEISKEIAEIEKRRTY